MVDGLVEFCDHLGALNYVKGGIRKATEQETRDIIQHAWQELE
jgi:hypothetical protein